MMVGNPTLGFKSPMRYIFHIEPDVGHIEKILTIFSAVMVANGGYPDMGKELRVQFSEAGFVNVEATGH